jgi:hypothetical protein
MNGQVIKRGMFSSLPQQPEPYVVLHPVANVQGQRRETVVQSTYTNDTSKPHPLPEELQGAKFATSTHTYGQPEVHFNYGNSGKSHAFVPPPPERFLVSSNHTHSQHSQPSQLPVQSGHPIQTVSQPLYQSIRKTFIPQHIYNEIPVLNSETKRYYEGSVQEEGEEGEEELNEADERMLEQYERLYQTYQEEKAISIKLARQLEEAEARLQEGSRQESKTEIREVVTVKEVAVDRPKRIDLKLLTALLLKKHQSAIDETVTRRKNSCLNKLRALFAEEESNLRTTLIRSSEEIVVRVRK